MGNDRLVAMVVSCLSEGLLLVDEGRVERLDRVPSAGLATGRLAARARHDPAETSRGALVDFEDGRTVRIEALTDPHDVAWEGDLLAGVATLGNAVLWADRAGRVVRRFDAPGDGDCWHLSGLAIDCGRTLVSAFGRFRRHRDWAEAPRDGTGFVLELPSGRTAAEGLSSPHSPRVVAGELLVCDSGRGDVLVGERRVRLGGWTRGAAASDGLLAVGVSAPRGSGGSAELVLLDRATLRILRRFALPVREVHDVAFLPAGRARRLVRAVPMTAPMKPLARADLRVRLAAPPALALRAGELGELECSLTNLGRTALATARPHPVSVVASWSPCGRALWSPLPGAVAPGQTVRVPVRYLAPERPGRYAIELGAVQDGVARLEGSARVAADVA
jgi:hypothetical protein